jgi:hypothetical protein
VTDLREEIVKTEKHEWRKALHLERQILEGVIESWGCNINTAPHEFTSLDQAVHA